MMPDRRLAAYKAFAAEVHCRLSEWEIADWLSLREEQRDRAARPALHVTDDERSSSGKVAPRQAAPTGPMLYSNGGRILYVR
jgi:hypothetical protein